VCDSFSKNRKKEDSGIVVSDGFFVFSFSLFSSFYLLFPLSLSPPAPRPLFFLSFYPYNRAYTPFTEEDMQY